MKRLQQNPGDPVALAQQGQLLLHDGQGDAALQMLRKAYNLDRTNDDTRSLLVRTLLDALKRDFASYQDIAGEVEPLLDQPQQRQDFLRLKAIGLQQAGDRVGAFTTLVSLTQLDGSERSDSPIAGLMTDSTDAQLRVRFDRWVAARLLELYRDSSGEDRAKLDALIAKQWEVPPANSTVQTWDGLLNHFGWHRSSELARVELATLRLEAGELLAAETLLMQFSPDARDLLAGRATALLATIYEKAGRRDFAAEQYQRLVTHWGDVVVRHDKTGRQLYEQAAKTPTVGRVLNRADHWPGGQIKLTEGADVVASGNGFSVYQRNYPVPLVEARGTLAHGAALQFGVSGSQLTLRDSLGNDLNQFSLRRPDSRAAIAPQTGLAHAHAVGHLLLVSLGQELVAVDALKASQGAADPSESTLWRQDLLPVPSNGSGGLQPVKPQIVPFTWTLPRTITMYEPDKVIGAVAAMSERAVCYARLRDIACVDPLTGSILWERSQTEPGSDLFGDDELLFVIPPRTDEATVLSVADGRVLGKRRVDRLDFRWATCGRNVLSCKQDGREFIVTLYDAWSEKTLWESRFNFGSRGTLIGRDEMAMMQPDGKLVIVSLSTGRVIIDTQVAPEPRLLNIFVVRSSQQYFVQMDTIIEAKDSASGVTIQPAPGGEYTKIVTGRMYAFDRASGQPSWQAPAYISQFGLVLDQ
ncbi:MAG TPA: PQQ-binding-like beta-propeller repeat protein, partial [Pirellulaceae bacterium]|nr:PQQ-binding-like beta-propeller repeat protein [Pirellulaceae bacterium]